MRRSSDIHSIPTLPNALEGAILTFEEPIGLYLNRAVLARRRLPPERVKEAVRDWLRTRPGIRAAWTNTEVANGLPATEPLALPVERAFRADRSPDVLLYLRPGWIFRKETGSSHGEPTDDDARVPLLAWGPGVRAGSWAIRVSPLSIARTIGALYGFTVGEEDAEVLQPVLGLDEETRAPGEKAVTEPFGVTVGDLLERDHRRLDGLFGRFLAAAAADEAAFAVQAITEFDAALRRHTELEEEHLYPESPGGKLAPTADEGDRERLVRELLLEHVQIREISGMMARLLVEKNDLAGARSLAGNLARRWDAHTEREERDAFPLLRDSVDPAGEAVLREALGRHRPSTSE